MKKIIIEASVPEWQYDIWKQCTHIHTKEGIPVFIVRADNDTDAEESNRLCDTRINLGYIFTEAMHQENALNATMSGDIDNYMP